MYKGLKLNKNRIEKKGQSVRKKNSRADSVCSVLIFKYSQKIATNEIEWFCYVIMKWMLSLT